MWESDVIDGVKEYRLDSWNEFVNLVHDKLEYDGYIWRGQRCDYWTLTSTLDRALSSVPPDKREAMKRWHLNNFKLASRGRRGMNPPELSEEEWWALGQHHGLATPLLDWSASPFVAAFFAFAEERLPSDETDRRAIWSISMNAIRSKAKELDPSEAVKLVIPLSNENPRLVNQAGVFTLAPDGIDLESWVKENFPGDKVIRLRKITIPDTERELALKALNRMNINYATLFPDLVGASLYCNMSLEIPRYQNRFVVYSLVEAAASIEVHQH